jgi:hypothetical protein
MNTHTRFVGLISLGLLAAGSAAMAADGQAVTRAEVVSQTAAARSAGSLTPAGEAPVPAQQISAAPSDTTRNSVQQEVLTARAAHALVPAGEGVGEGFDATQPVRSEVIVSRAQVKASVIAARRDGDLVPAGEGPDVQLHARAKASSSLQTARRSTGLGTVAN